MSTISAAASQFNAVTQRRTSVGVISMQQPRYFRLLALAAVALCSQLPCSRSSALGRQTRFLDCLGSRQLGPGFVGGVPHRSERRPH